jgi:hypothetical protein
MKKQLLTALLILTSFFSFSNQHSNNDELTYLKQIKVDIQQYLQDINRYEKELKKKWNRWGKDYTRAIKTWNNLYSFFKTEKKKEPENNAFESLDPFNLNIMYNDKKDLNEIAFAPGADPSIFISSFLPTNTTHHKVKAIITKYFKNMTAEEFLAEFNNWRMLPIIADRPYLIQLLKKVNAKIAELQKI